jgi:tetratricopeptide (TPR) repeat protein
MVIPAFLSVLYSDLGHYSLALEITRGLLDVGPTDSVFATTFYLGAVLLTHVRAGKVTEAEAIVKDPKFSVHQMNFFSKQYAELALCYLPYIKGEYEDAIQSADQFYRWLKANGVVYLTQELLLLIGKSQVALGWWDQALDTIKECQSVTEKLGSRRIQWQVDALLAQCAQHEGNYEKVEEHLRESRQTIQYILDHISDPALKDSYLAKEDVRQVLEMEAEVP